jgi:hypothetical protein
MKDLSLILVESWNLAPEPVLGCPEYDDDDDAANPDEDEDEGLEPPRQERWSYRAGFGSPRWWSGS